MSKIKERMDWMHTPSLISHTLTWWFSHCRTCKVTYLSLHLSLPVDCLTLRCETLIIQYTVPVCTPNLHLLALPAYRGGQMGIADASGRLLFFTMMWSQERRFFLRLCPVNLQSSLRASVKWNNGYVLCDSGFVIKNVFFFHLFLKT